jgi:hypothetical protein
MLKLLQSPMFLVGQGFAVGAALFLATHPGSIELGSLISAAHF